MLITCPILRKIAFFVLAVYCWFWPGSGMAAGSYWDAIFQLGYDPFTQQVSNQLACRRINNLYEMRMRVSEHLEVDPELESRIQELHSRLTSLDAANLYEILPYSDPAESWRGVGIRGSSDSQRYYLKMYDPAIKDWLAADGRYVFRFKFPDAHLGDIDLRSFIKPEQKDTFVMAAEAQVYLDDIPVQSVPRMLDGVLHTIWLHAGIDVKLSTEFPAKTLLNRQSTSVLNGLIRDFPGLFRILLKYFMIKNIVSSESDLPDGSELLEITIVFNEQAIAEDFPEIKELLNELKDSVFLRIRLHDDQNRLLGMIEIDSVIKEITIQLRIKGGHLLALTGRPGDRHQSRFNLTAPGHQQLFIAYDIHLNIVGLRLNIESLPISVDYINQGEDLDLKLCQGQPPESVNARGWAFGFIPLWLVNALIPSNVEEITTHFFETLGWGNDGNGTIIDIAGRGAMNMKSHIDLQAGTEVLGNGTIKLAFNMQRKVVAKQDALLKEIREFNDQFAAAFYQDYQRAKRMRGCQ